METFQLLVCMYLPPAAPLLSLVGLRCVAAPKRGRFVCLIMQGYPATWTLGNLFHGLVPLLVMQ